MNDKQELIYKKLKGRDATIRFDLSGHNIPVDTRIIINKYDEQRDKFAVTSYDGATGKPSISLVDLSEINFRDTKYNLKSIILKGHRTERSDNYDYYAIELMDDEKSIYLSTYVRSLLFLNPGDYVGFSFDTDTRRIMIFKAKDDKEGWELAGNGRIKSSADWRELMNEYGKSISVSPELFTDDENYPGYLFYNLENVRPKAKPSKGKSSKGFAILDASDENGMLYEERRETAVTMSTPRLNNNAGIFITGNR